MVRFKFFSDEDNNLRECLEKCLRNTSAYNNCEISISDNLNLDGKYEGDFYLDIGNNNFYRENMVLQIDTPALDDWGTEVSIKSKNSKQTFDEPIIYTIYLCEDVRSKSDSSSNNGLSSVPGFFLNKHSAEWQLEEEGEKIHEDKYKYACIEAYLVGIRRPIYEETVWFEWNEENKTYKKIPTPKGELYVCCRAMG